MRSSSTRRRSPAAAWLAALLVAAAGCLHGSSTLEQDEAKLRAMRADIEALVGEPSCADGSECAFVAFGAKPCGGPWTYLIYSRADVRESPLLEKVERYNAFEDAMNRRHGRISDCAIAVPPTIRCEDGTCRSVPGEP